ncbi:MAG: hypothetical protein ACT4PM_09020 [Gemmatimonadales bacterium]
MRNAARAAFAAGLFWWLGCGDLPTTSEGVAFLEIEPPPSTTIQVGDTLHFQARTLDRSGNPLEVLVRWRTPDTTITVGETTGLVVGVYAGSGRVQAAVGEDELVSDFITVTVQEPPAPALLPRRAR